MQKSQSSSVVEHAIGFVELARPLVEAVQRKDQQGARAQGVWVGAEVGASASVSFDPRCFEGAVTR